MTKKCAAGGGGGGGGRGLYKIVQKVSALSPPHPAPRIIPLNHISISLKFPELLYSSFYIMYHVDD